MSQLPPDPTGHSVEEERAWWREAETKELTRPARRPYHRLSAWEDRAKESFVRRLPEREYGLRMPNSEAMHEGAHAAAGWLTGAGIRRVCLEPPDLPELLGVCSFTGPPPPVAIAAPMWVSASMFHEIQRDLEALNQQHQLLEEGRDGWWDQLYADVQVMVRRQDFRALVVAVASALKEGRTLSGHDVDRLAASLEILRDRDRADVDTR